MKEDGTLESPKNIEPEATSEIKNVTKEEITNEDNNEIEEANTTVLIDIDVLENNKTNNTKENITVTELPQNLQKNESRVLLPPHTSEGSSSVTPQKEETSAPSEENAPTQTPRQESSSSEKKTRIALYNDGQKILEGRITDSPQLQLEQKERRVSKGYWAKEVTIASNEHVEDELTAFAAIDPLLPSEKGRLSINWKNKGEEVVVKEWFDENDDGYYEKVSWIVPHLSTQIFEIVIAEPVEDTPEGTLEIIAPINGSTIPGEITIGYSLNVTTPMNCTLEIDGEEKTLSGSAENFDWEHSLLDGDYSLKVECTNQTDTLSDEVSFTVAESLSWNASAKHYKKGDPVTLTLSGTNSIGAELFLTTPTIPSTTYNQTGNPTIFTLSGSVVEGVGLYTAKAKPHHLEGGSEITTNFTVFEAKIITDKTTANIGVPITINPIITATGSQITSVLVDFGNGTINYDDLVHTNQAYNKAFTGVYSAAGTKTIIVTYKLLGESTTRTETKTITITSGADTTKPALELLDPKDNLVTSEDRIIFSWKASDEAKIDKCTFELYNVSGAFGILEYDEERTNIVNNQRIELTLQSFDEQEYRWYVSCIDNSSNSREESRSFTIHRGGTSSSTKSANEDYTEKETVDEARANLDEFLDKVATFTKEEEEAYKYLGLEEDIKYYKKRLLQIDQDLAHNIAYLSDNQERETRREETLDEFFEIEGMIPESFTLKETIRFSENSNPTDTEREKVVGTYATATESGLTKKEQEKLARSLEKLQEELTKETTAYVVEVKTGKGTQTRTAVKRTLETTMDARFLEFYPEEFEERVYQTDITEVSGDLIEGELEEGEPTDIIFVIEGEKTKEDLKEIITILYEDNGGDGRSITGLAIGDVDWEASLWYSLIATAALGIMMFGTQKMRKTTEKKKWRKDERAKATQKELRAAKEAAKEGDVNTTKEKYYKIKESFPYLTKSYRDHIYPDVKKLREFIDRKEIGQLVKAYFEAKRAGMKEDEKKLYEDVRKVYRRLPKKYRQKVYEKMFKEEEVF